MALLALIRGLAGDVAVLALDHLLPFPSAAAVQEAVTIEPHEKWSNVFGNQEMELHFTVKSPKALQGRVGWVFASTDKRTFSRGEAPVTAGPEKPATVNVRVMVPPVKDGVILQALLTVAVYGDAPDKPEATIEKNLWIFPPDPFVDRTQWLKDLKLTLFDPKATTAGVLEKMNIPFDDTRNVAALGELSEGLLLIGEEVSFKEDRDLAETMPKVAARGVPVLCLAPAEGVFPLPGTDNRELPEPASLSFRRQDVITELDKRLDAEAWPPEGELMVNTFVIKAEAGNVVSEIVHGTKGWTWIEVKFPEKKSKLAVCSCRIIRQWDESPTPRFLFARVLERLSEKSESEPVTERTGAK